MGDGSHKYSPLVRPPGSSSLFFPLRVHLPCVGMEAYIEKLFSPMRSWPSAPAPPSAVSVGVLSAAVAARTTGCSTPTRMRTRQPRRRIFRPHDFNRRWRTRCIICGDKIASGKGNQYCSPFCKLDSIDNGGGRDIVQRERICKLLGVLTEGVMRVAVEGELWVLARPRQLLPPAPVPP
ncbi:hypothetical protein ZWY2020_016630 [Hordeum vulgare]|nr:hypothetical protein ZWY2020_016630 [Hordeum vulgare]